MPSRGATLLLPILGGLKPSQHRLCRASRDAPCRAELALGFVVSFQTQSCFFHPFQANIGQKEDFEAARKKALALGAKKVTASLPPGAQGALSSSAPCCGAEPWGLAHPTAGATMLGDNASQEPLFQRFCTKAF